MKFAAKGDPLARHLSKHYLAQTVSKSEIKINGKIDWIGGAANKIEAYCRYWIDHGKPIEECAEDLGIAINAIYVANRKVTGSKPFSKRPSTQTRFENAKAN